MGSVYQLDYIVYHNETLPFINIWTTYMIYGPYGRGMLRKQIKLA